MTTLDDTTHAPSAHERRDARTHRRRHPWRWVIALVIVVVVLVVGFFVAESVLRGIVENDIRENVSSALSLPSDADADVDVTVGGVVIPQLIAGSLDDVTVTSSAVPVGSATAGVVFQASGVPIRGGDLGSATADITLPADAVASLLASDASVKDVTLADSDVDATITVPAAGTDVQAVVALAPSVADGDLVLTPQSYEVDGQTLSVEQAQSALGADSTAAAGLATPRTVCVKADVPTGLTLDSVEIGQGLTAHFTVASGILDQPDLQKKGTCG